MREPLRLPSSGLPVPEPREGAGGEPEAFARREHSLRSLLELSHELTVALGVHETADLLLFNLMGQFRTPRAAAWLFPQEASAAQPTLVRSHGFHRALLDAIGSTCTSVLRKRFDQNTAPALSWTLRDAVGAGEFELVRHASIAVVAPLCAREELLGWVALGERLDGTPYEPEDLEVLEAALGMVAVSLQNVRLYNQAREMNRRLRASNEYLTELDRLKNEFLSNVNHELRTPLAVVIGSLECVVTAEREDAAIQNLLTASLDQAKKLGALIENLLNFADAQNARLSLECLPGDAAAVARDCYDVRFPGVAAGLRELVFRSAPTLRLARFDRGRLLQILDELIDNAVKFTPSGSRIEIAVAHATEDGREWVQIEVTDNGPGIAPEAVRSLFHSFEQIDGSATRRVGGLGMGLAFAQRLAVCMDSRLTVASTLGKGTTFRLLLPGA